MNILETLKIVRGAVGERSLLPILTHFHIENGRIYGGNGKMSIDAPFPQVLEGAITVPAKPFLDAVDRCEGDPSFERKGDFLYLRSKVRKMRVIRLPTMPGSQYVMPTRPAEMEELDAEGYLAALAAIRPFISNDASRPWSMAALHDGEYLYATNNVVIARMPFKWTGSAVAVPAFVIDELTRINKRVEKIHITSSSVVFRLEDDIFLQSVLFGEKWPDVHRMIQTENVVPVPSDLHKIVNDLAPFNEDHRFPVIVFRGDVVRTLESGMEAQDKLDSPVGKAAFHLVPLNLVLSAATHLDLSNYPGPCGWKGPKLEGMIMGVTVEGLE